MLKRFFDIVISAVAAVLLLCPCILIAMAVKATSPGPAIHWSCRMGRRGAPFKMPKFRTMKADTPQVATDKLPNPRSHLTPIGGALRALSIDEIPQLWSVLNGDMSMVGPRPALFTQHELISERARRGIDALRPGITGWAQINGRDEISEHRKIELDEEYLNSHSAWMDVKILIVTLWRAFRREGVAH